uniref:Uncharacterized protein LOC102802904 n=1 Tax=Saccoglossus kowalevskii TaxID=10224 RepID=A0ABM0MKS7_SACKO
RSDESGNKGIHTTRSISRTITDPLDRKESQQASADRSRTEKLRRIGERIRRVENTDAVDFDVTLLDFAGQQVYEMSHQMFMAMLGIYILVVDLSLKLDDVVPYNLGGKKKTLRGTNLGTHSSLPV